MTYTIRAYTPADEPAWLRCRVLSFFHTAYFDDVHRTKPLIPAPGFELVAVDATGVVAGLMDVTVEDGPATIDSVAVHPDHQRRGIGRDLLDAARERLSALPPGAVTVLDAWTRDDPDTLEWYRARGFEESSHYLHVYVNHYVDAAEPERAVGAGRPGLRLMMGFLHAKLADEEQLRREFSRVHVCRRFAMAV